MPRGFASVLIDGWSFRLSCRVHAGRSCRKLSARFRRKEFGAIFIRLLRSRRKMWVGQILMCRCLRRPSYNSQASDEPSLSEVDRRFCLVYRIVDVRRFHRVDLGSPRLWVRDCHEGGVGENLGGFDVPLIERTHLAADTPQIESYIVYRGGDLTN